MENINFNPKSSGGGGGGSATSANQLTEISKLDSLLTELQQFESQNNINLTNVISQLGGSISSTNVLAKEATLQKLVQNSNAVGFTNLFNLLTTLNTLATSANQVTEIARLTSIVSNQANQATSANQGTTNIILDNIQTLQNTANSSLDSIRTNTDMISGTGGLFVRYDTGAVRVVNVGYAVFSRTQQKKLTLQIDANAGAVGTLNIQVRTNNLAPYITVPLLDLQATFASAFVAPPYNVAGAKIYSLDVSGYFDVRITPSVLIGTFFYYVTVTN